MSPELLLRKAYEVISKPVLAVCAGTGYSGLSAFDRHAEAANLIGWCERNLTPLQMAYVRVQFGRESAGLNALVEHLAAVFGTGIHNRHAIEKIIRAYCGEKIGLREIRKTMACGMLKAVSYRNRGYDALDLLNAQVVDRVRVK